ncbi:uncharacterized protein LOC144443308 [Glandiceps talaboti]
MAYSVTSQRIPELLKYITRWRPQCNPLYFMIKNSHQTNNTWPHLNIYTDNEQFHSCKTVVCKANNFYKPPYNITYFAYSTDGGSLTTLLKQDGVVDRRVDYTAFELVPTCIVNNIKKVMCDQMDFAHIMEAKYKTFVFDQQMEELIAAKPLPEGLTLGPLSSEHVQLLEEKNALPFTPKFAKTLEQYKHLAAYDENQTPVAWVIHKEYGDMGYSYTEPAFRKLDLFSILARILTLEVSEFEIEPYAIVHTNNYQSVVQIAASTLRFRLYKDFDMTRLCLKKKHLVQNVNTRL